MIEDIEPDVQVNLNEIYPHSGTFLLKRTDGTMSIVYINKGIEPYVEFLTGWQEVFVPNANVMDSRVDEAQMDEMIKCRMDELEQEFKTKRMELDHQHEIRMMKIENEQPKRNSQGEWISGKTLTEIIKLIAHPEVRAL